MASRFTLTAELRLRAPRNLRQVASQIKAGLGQINVPIHFQVPRNAHRQLNQVSVGIQKVNKSAEQTSKTAEQAATDIERFGEQAALAVRRYGAFTLATAGFVALGSAIKTGTQEAISFQRELVKISQVTGRSLKDLSGITDEITRLSVKFGVSSKELLEASRILSQTGLSATETKAALEALAKSDLAPTFGDINKTAEASIAIMRQFGVEANELESVLGSINKVAGSFAVESDDIATAIRRTGGAFVAAGGNINELIALFTSVRATTRESAESIATGFRTIFTRIQRTRTQNFLKDLGIDLQTLEGQFVGPFEAIKRLNEGLRNLPSTDPRFNQIIEELGGFRQVSKVIPLVQQFATAQNALRTAQQGTASVTKDAATAQQALAIQFKAVREDFLALIRTISNNAAFQGMIALSLKLASALIKIGEAIEPLLPLLAAFAVTKVGANARTFLTGFGRKIHPGKFFTANTGGIVPGSGNTDTVPAMLTPGEFVLRKEAVQSIGKDNIAKFNQGGEVSIDDVLNAKGSKGKVTQDSVIGLFKSKGINLTQTEANKLVKPANRKDPLAKQTLSKNLSTIMAGKSFGGMAGGANVAAEVLGNFGGLFLRGKGTGDTMFNASLPFKSLPGDVQKSIERQVFGGKQRNRSINSVVGKSRAYFIQSDGRKVFDDTAEKLVTGSVDRLARLISPDAGRLSQLEDKKLAEQLLHRVGLDAIQGNLFEGAISAYSGIFAGDKAGIFDFTPQNVGAAQSSLLGKLFNPKGAFPPYLDAKKSYNVESQKRILGKAAKEFSRMSGSFRIADSKFASQTLTKSTSQKRNKGGGILGSGDTVPAMLTPGEFVFSKEAVDRIGVENLKKANEFTGFNKGGLVGYKSGGKVSGGQRGGLSTGAILAGSSVFSSLFSVVGEGEGAMSSLTDSVLIVSSRLLILRELLESVEHSSFFQSLAGKKTDPGVDSARYRPLQFSQRRKKKAQARFLNAPTNQLSLSTSAHRRQLANAYGGPNTGFGSARAMPSIAGAPSSHGGMFANMLAGGKRSIRRTRARGDGSLLRGIGRTEITPGQGLGKLPGAGLLDKLISSSKSRIPKVAGGIAKNVGKYGSGALTGGLIASELGSAIKSSDFAKDAFGEENAATIGGVVSKGGQGAALGLALGGPIGALVGGLGGMALETELVTDALSFATDGVIDLETSAEKAADRLADKEFAQSLQKQVKEVNKITGDLDSGGGIDSQELGKLMQAAKKTRNGMRGLDEQQSKVAKEASKQLIPSLKSAAVSIAEQGGSYEDLQTAVGPLVDIMGGMGVNSHALMKQLKGVQEEANRLANSTARLTAAQVQMLREIEAISTVSQALNNANRAAQSFASQVQSMTGSFESSVNPIFEQALKGTADLEAFRMAAKDIGGRLGGPGQQLAQNAIADTEVIKAIPKVIAQAAAEANKPQGKVREGETVGDFIRRFGKQALSGTAGQKDRQEKLLNSVIENIEGSEGNDVSNVRALQGGLQETIKKFQGAFQISTQALQRFNEQLVKADKALVASFQSRKQIEQEYTKNIQSLYDIRLDKEKAVADAQGREVSLGAKLSTIAKKRGATLSGTGLGANATPEEIGNKLRETKAKRQAIVAAAGPGGTLNPAQRAEEQVLTMKAEKLGAALDSLADSTESYQAIQQELSKEQAKRAAKGDLAKEFLFADEKGRRNIAKDMINTLQVSTGVKNFSQVRPEDRKGIQSMMERLGDVAVPGSGGGVDFNRVQESLLTSQFGPMSGVTVKSDREKKLESAAVGAQVKREKAAEERVKTSKTDRDRADELIQKQIKAFTDELTKALTDNTLAKAMNEFPRSVEHNFKGQVDININGAEALASLAPKMKEMINSQVTSQMNKIIEDKMPDAGPVEVASTGPSSDVNFENPYAY